MTKRRKRELSGLLDLEGYPLRWTLKSEQIWSPKGEHVGLRLSIERADKTRRELVLSYPFQDLPGGKTARPDVDQARLVRDIAFAIEAGWDPNSRGRPFEIVFEPEDL